MIDFNKTRPNVKELSCSTTTKTQFPFFIKRRLKSSKEREGRAKGIGDTTISHVLQHETCMQLCTPVSKTSFI